MQPTNAPTHKQFHAIEFVLQPERLQRYMPAAGKNPQIAFQFYLWNCALCESFYLPLHFCEIACRNALQQILLNRVGNEWFRSKLFLYLLEDRFRRELQDACAQESAQHGDRMTSHHVVSALTFGFWEHLATKRFDRLLWAKGVRSVFPHAPKEATREDVHRLIESVRRWRNRIAHHRAIFDKGPMRKHQDILKLIGWICDDTGGWVGSVSRVPLALSRRPERHRDR